MHFMHNRWRLASFFRHIFNLGFILLRYRRNYFLYCKSSFNSVEWKNGLDSLFQNLTNFLYWKLFQTNKFKFIYKIIRKNKENYLLLVFEILSFILFLETFIVFLPHQIKQIEQSKINIVNAIIIYIFYKNRQRKYFPFSSSTLN